MRPRRELFARAALRVRDPSTSLRVTAGETRAKEMCHSTKRTHRFLAKFFMDVPMNALVAFESYERNRWVRFGKRTHRFAFAKATARLGWRFWWGSVAATTTSRHLVRLGLENEPTGEGFGVSLE